MRSARPLLPLLLLLPLLTGCFGAPRYEGPPSDHFDGAGRFFNAGVESRGLLDLLVWMLTQRKEPWRDRVPATIGPPPPRRVGAGELRVTWVGHATVLVQMDGLNVLTDPIWSDRASPLSFAGPLRVRPPGLRLQDLPPIDAVIVSHDHYDHCDLETIARLARDHHPRIFAGLGMKRIFDDAGIAGAQDLDWWQSAGLAPGVTLTCVPAQHSSRRGVLDGSGRLWCGWALRGPSGIVYFAGDTGLGPHFAEIARRLGPPRLALLPIGAYRPRWFMEPLHMSPEDAVTAAQRLGAATSIGIHWGTFALADEGEMDPVIDLEEALARRGERRPRFWVVTPGSGNVVPPM